MDCVAKSVSHLVKVLRVTGPDLWALGFYRKSMMDIYILEVNNINIK